MVPKDHFEHIHKMHCLLTAPFRSHAKMIIFFLRELEDDLILSAPDLIEPDHSGFYRAVAPSSAPNEDKRDPLVMRRVVHQRSIKLSALSGLLPHREIGGGVLIIEFDRGGRPADRLLFCGVEGKRKAEALCSVAAAVWPDYRDALMQIERDRVFASVARVLATHVVIVRPDLRFVAANDSGQELLRSGRNLHPGAWTRSHRGCVLP